MKDPCAWCNEPSLFLQDGICDACYWWAMWPNAFAAACTMCLQIPDDIGKRRLYNELRAIDMIAPMREWEP